MSRDMMPSFELFQPATVDDALALLDRYEATPGCSPAATTACLVQGPGEDARRRWSRSRDRRAEGHSRAGGGLEIGALTTLTEVERHPLVRERFACSPTPRARSRARRSATPAPSAATSRRTPAAGTTATGSTATARAATPATPTRPEGMNREHALFGADRCVAVTPSDTGPALVALDASMVIRGARASASVEAEDFFIGPEVDIERMTVLEAGEILTAIRIPAPGRARRSTSRRSPIANTWDFALVNVAAAMKVTAARSRTSASPAAASSACRSASTWWRRWSRAARRTRRPRRSPASRRCAAPRRSTTTTSRSR